MSETSELWASVERLVESYPELPRDVVTSLFGDCYEIVVDATSRPLVARAEELARLKLDLRTSHLVTPGASISQWRGRPTGPTPGAELLCQNCGALLARGWCSGTEAAGALGQHVSCGLCGRVTDIRLPLQRSA